ncbi:hypothetical protein SLS62_004173 [Diatrype stigma]|uniref:EthD domain-containing protein n=1 Tax=Diatrype stigma TaxID=117547 RepID=A0AAN9UV17_9PEZI
MNSLLVEAIKIERQKQAYLPTPRQRMATSELPGDGALVSLGGPLFRKPGTSHEEFSLAWHRHAQIVVPWLLEFGIVEYVQIHLPSPSPGEKAPAAKGIDHTLREADGVALVRCRSVPSVDRVMRPFGDGLTHPYLEKVIAVNERFFLHEESGISAVKREPPTFEVPDLPADEWRNMALRIGGVEHVKIRGAKDVIEGSWWDEWEKIELGISN